MENFKQKIKKDKNTEIPKEPKKPLKPRITTQNATVEALCMAVNSNKDVKYGIGIWVDELGLLLKGLNQYKSGEGNDRQYFLQAWNKIKQNIVRKNNNEDYTIIASHNIIGGIQPDILNKTLFKDGICSTDGMLERWLFCCTDYEETGILPDFKEKYDISALENCCKNIFKFKKIPKEYIFDDVAHKQFKDICKTITDNNNKHNISNLMANYMVKQKSYIARFSLILHCMSNLENDKISVQTLNNAVKLSQYFISCFSNITNEKIDTQEKEKIWTLCKNKKIYNNYPQ